MWQLFYMSSKSLLKTLQGSFSHLQFYKNEVKKFPQGLTTSKW